MAADVQHLSHGGRLEGLSIVAGAAHLLSPDARGSNANSATLRASYQNYPGILGPGEVVPGQLPPFHRSLTMESYGPKLVQGDYTYHTVRRNLTLSSQILTGLLVPPTAAAQPSHRGTIPAMMPTSAGITNAAAWKAYGSPSARGRSRPPPAPVASHANNNPQVISGMTSKLPRVHALGGGFRLPRPHSAPNAPTGETLAGPEGTASTPTRQLGGSAAGTVAAVPAATAAVPVLLEVDVPDPLGVGKTDSGKLMFEHTLPTDPYGKYLWEEQARKARANMNRHIAAMAAAAAVNGGLAFGHGSISGGGSRPASARRGAAAPAPTSPTGAGAAAGGVGPAMRPRFSSNTLAELHRQGLDYRPQTVLGFAAPDITEDATLPGPNDPRWAYTRLGRTQVERLQQTLKMADRPASPRRPASEPSASPAGDQWPGAPGASTISSPERSWAPREEGSLPAALPLPPVAEQRSAYGGAGSGRWPEPAARARSPSAVSAGAAGTLSRPASASLGRTASAFLPRPSSASMARPGSASLVRPGSAASGRPSSAAARPSSASRNGGGSSSGVAAAAALMAESSAAPPAGVRGSSAGRSRGTAPNPRVDLRAYLAEEQAAAEDDDEGVTEMLQVGDLYEVLGGAGGGLLPVEVSQGMGMVPPEALAARLAEVVAAAAMVAAQQQMEEEQQVQVQQEEGAAAGAGVEVEVDGGGAEQAAAGAAAPAAPAEGQGSRRGSGGSNSGADALEALHGASAFGRAPNGGRYSDDAFADYTAQGGRAGGGGEDGIGGDGNADGPGDEDLFEEDRGAELGPRGLGLGLGLGVGLSQRPGRGRPGSARPMSARPTSARPSSAMPTRKRSGGGSRLSAALAAASAAAGEDGAAAMMAEEDGGMHVIHEQSESGAAEEAEV